MALFRPTAAAAFVVTLFAVSAPIARAQFSTGPNTTTPATLTPEVKKEIMTALEDVVTKRAFVPGLDLTKWPEFVAKQQEAIDKADSEAAFARAVNTAFREFGISHIRFVTPRASQNRTRTTDVGVGVVAQPSPEGLTVTRVFEASPADLAGIKSGDLIVKVDGAKPADASVLNGENGSEVAITVKPKEGAEKEIKVKRSPFSIVRRDTLTWVGDDAAVLRINSFSRGYDRKNIEDRIAEAAKAKYLILDLRSNGGGAVNNMQHLLNLLLPENAEVGTFLSRQTVDRILQANASIDKGDPLALAAAAPDRMKARKPTATPFTGKIAVLINRGSASASEITAAALRENLGSPLVGVRTAGAVLASVFRRLPHGYEVQYPVSDYVTAKGMRLEKNPLVPDIEVTEPVSEGKDPGVEKALEKLKSS